MPNSAPVIYNPDTLIIASDSDPISFGIAAPTDADGDALTITLTGLPIDGLVEYWDGSGWQTASSGEALTGAELASLRYTPSSTAHGPENLSYTVFDGHTTVTGSTDVSVLNGAGGADTMYFSAVNTGDLGPDLFSLTADGQLTADPIRTDANATYGSLAGEDGGFANLGGDLYFNAFSTSTGEVLMKVGADGLVAPVDRGDGGYFASTGDDSNFTLFNGDLYFRASGIGGDELFSVSANGDTHAWDINPGAGLNSSPGAVGGFAVFDNALYFSATGPDNNIGQEDLFRLDSSGQLTSLAIRTGPNAAYGSFAGEDGGYVVFNNALYFNAYTDSTGDTLFKLAAGSSTAVSVDAKDIDHSDASQINSAFHVFNDNLYFNDFSNSVGGETLFQLDTAGAVTALTYNGEALTNAGAAGGFVDMGGATYFIANTADTGTDLFKLDTSGAITAIDVNPGSADAFDDTLPETMIAFNGSLYFDAYNADFTESLHKLDADGTLSTINLLGPDIADAGASGFKIFDGVLYFEAYTNDGIELVSIDANGFVNTIDINQGGDSHPGEPGGFGVLTGQTFTGTAGDDILAAGYTGASLAGGDGADLLRSGGGDDTLDGGNGVDTASYDNAAAGVTVDLGIGSAQATGGAGVDTLISIENLLGSSFDDHLTGDGGDNLLSGAGGNDTLSGGGGADLLTGGAGDDTLSGGLGADTLVGGQGTDTASFSDTVTAETIDLSLKSAIGDGGTDVLRSIENVVGSALDDTITGNGSANMLNGGGGDDRLMGSNGADTLIGGTGADTLDGGRGADVLTGGDGADTFAFASTAELRVGQDVITDLSNVDVIDLSQLDAQSHQAGRQPFEIVTAFDGHKGEIVIHYDAGTNRTSFQFDLNGDGVADAGFVALGDHHDFTNFTL